eukprot:4847985-Heterocapsa_arctica.AAC.1
MSGPAPASVLAVKAPVSRAATSNPDAQRTDPTRRTVTPHAPRDVADKVRSSESKPRVSDPAGRANLSS